MQLNFFLHLCVEDEQAFVAHCSVPESLGEIELKRFLLQLSEANASSQLSVCFSRYLFAHHCQPAKHAEAR